jgi:hypothetical protein
MGLAIPRPTRLGDPRSLYDAFVEIILKLLLPSPKGHVGSFDATSNLLVYWLDWLFNHLTGIVEIGMTEARNCKDVNSCTC